MNLSLWSPFFAGLYLCFRGLGFFLAGHAILKVRASQSAIAWAMALSLFPSVGIPLYFLLGARRFKGYVLSRRRGELDIQQITKHLAPKLAPYMFQKSEIPESMRVLQHLAKFPFTNKNHTEILLNGEQTYGSMLEGLEKAQSYVIFQFFIIHNDEHGKIFRDKLLACAKRGIRVYLLIDPIGSGDLPSDFFLELIAAGAECKAFNSPKWSNRYRLNFRNHRKIIVVDGISAWVGGLNIGDAYVGKGKRFKHWRDTHLKLAGPLVMPIQLAFLEDWYWTTKSLPDLNWEPKPASSNNQKALVVPTGPNDVLDVCELFFIHLIHQAKNRLWISSPYFVPNDTVLSALQLAALRGVDVRIMIPQNPDHLLVYLSGFTFLSEANKAGIKIYRYQPGFLHQKVVLIDEDQTVVGTANLDNRSFRINFEISVLVKNQSFTNQMAEYLQDDFYKCRLVDTDELREKSLWFRLAARISRLLAPLQ